MNTPRALGRHLCRGGALATVAVLASAGVALASNAVKGASYSGHYTGKVTDTISFTVSANGKRVTDLSVTTPFRCNGGCGGVPSPIGGSASISKKGRFKATLKLLELGSSKSFGTDTVIGTFEKHGKAKGTVSSHFNADSSGETVSWTATS
jgi:hypothetical protein